MVFIFPSKLLLCVCALRVRLFVTPWTVACRTLLSTGFSRQQYWSGLLFSSPGDLSDPGIGPPSLASPSVAGQFFTTSATWEAPKLLRFPTKTSPSHSSPVLVMALWSDQNPESTSVRPLIPNTGTSSRSCPLRLCIKASVVSLPRCHHPSPNHGYPASGLNAVACLISLRVAFTPALLESSLHKMPFHNLKQIRSYFSPD